MLEFLFQPFLYIVSLPAIVWQVYSDKEKQETLEDLGTALIITLVLVAIRYGL